MVRNLRRIRNAGFMGLLKYKDVMGFCNSWKENLVKEENRKTYEQNKGYGSGLYPKGKEQLGCRAYFMQKLLIYSVR